MSRGSFPNFPSNLNELINFYSLWNHQKTIGFPMISGGITLIDALNLLHVRSKIWRWFLKIISTYFIHCEETKQLQTHNFDQDKFFESPYKKNFGFIQLTKLKLKKMTFMLLVALYTPWKYQETRGFLIFSGGLQRDQVRLI